MNHRNSEQDAASPKISVRSAVSEDRHFMIKSEMECFVEHRRSTTRSILHSIKSSNQQVSIAELDWGNGTTESAGVVVVFIYKRSLRLYSLAVLPQFRRFGVGETLLQATISLSMGLGNKRVTLEADTANHALIQWYQKFGFEISKILPDYYQKGESAYRMIRRNTEHSDRLILVTDGNMNLSSLTDCNVVTATNYLASNTGFSGPNSYHVVNFCDTHSVHSIGYYVSLMASARNHRVIPSAMTFNDFTDPVVTQSVLDEIQNYLHQKLKNSGLNRIEITILLGKAISNKYSDIGKRLFSLFNLPLFAVVLEKEEKWILRKIETLTLEQVARNHPEILKNSLIEYQRKRYHRKRKIRKYKYDLAILVNHDEEHPPSCPIALEKFANAAEKIGFFVEFITKTDKHRICEFDALFIRETTSLGNHTYSLSRHAYTEGLVIIDDPWSILLCSNKIYLHERLTHSGILQPKGHLFSKNLYKQEELDSLTYPLVLKLPESAFSLGVFRVENSSEMAFKLNEMFKVSDLVLAQEFLASDYDWRIGVLDNQPLFACKYYMANQHWQIYNWKSEIEEDYSGQHETVPIQQVPHYVLKAALKVAALIGNGLYGIDIKDINKKAYVIEINDNPNVDNGVEDALLGDELYERIMHSIYNRIETERFQTRYLL